MTSAWGSIFVSDLWSRDPILSILTCSPKEFIRNWNEGTAPVQHSSQSFKVMCVPMWGCRRKGTFISYIISYTIYQFILVDKSSHHDHVHKIVHKKDNAQLPKRTWLWCVHKKDSVVFIGISFTYLKLFITSIHLPEMIKIIFAVFQIQVDWKSIRASWSRRPWLSCHGQSVSWGIILPYVASMKRYPQDMEAMT